MNLKDFNYSSEKHRERYPRDAMPPKKIKRNQIEGQQKSREKFQKVCELLHQRYQRG